MDAHPTPYPGKRGIGAKSSTARTGDVVKAPKQPPWQGVAAAQPRPKRAFGTVRSTNVPVEKPLLISKPRKPPAAAKNPSIPDAAARATSRAKKHQVSFQDPKPAVAKASEKDVLEEAVHTPVTLTKAAASGTPYLSAQNCSKCKLDKLESSTYWLAQIRLAGSTGKHFVSAAFFRLALECHAQPFHKLRSELGHYVTRYQVNSMESVWNDLSQAYGLAKEKLDSDSCEHVQKNSLLAEMNDSIDKLDINSCTLDQCHISLAEKDDSDPNFLTALLSCCEEQKDGCLENDNVDGVQVDESLHDASDLKDNHGHEMESSRMELTESSLVDISSGNTTSCDVNSTSSRTNKRQQMVSGKKSSGKGSCRSSALPSESSSQKVKTPKSCPSAGKGRETLLGNQQIPKASANNPISNDGGGRKNKDDCVTGKNKEEENEKSSSRELSMKA